MSCSLSHRPQSADNVVGDALAREVPEHTTKHLQLLTNPLKIHDSPGVQPSTVVFGRCLLSAVRSLRLGVGHSTRLILSPCAKVSSFSLRDSNVRPCSNRIHELQRAHIMSIPNRKHTPSPSCRAEPNNVDQWQRAITVRYPEL